MIALYISDPDDPKLSRDANACPARTSVGAGRRVVALPEAAVPSRQRTPPDEDMHRELVGGTRDSRNEPNPRYGFPTPAALERRMPVFEYNPATRSGSRK